MFKSLSSVSILLCVIFSLTLIAQPEHRKNEAKRKAESTAKWMAKEIKATSNQNSYDVLHYLIDIDFQPQQENIVGLVEATVKVIEGALDKIELDFSNNMSVDSVYHNGVKSSFSHSGNIVAVNLNSPANQNDITTVSVYYHGRPQTSGLGSFGFDSYLGKPLIWTLSEPYGSREWWPCKDIPGDKADSVDLRLTVPEPMIVASNGTLIGETTHDGKTTFVWKESYPIPTYLISVTAYEYKKYFDYYVSMELDTMPIEFYVAPTHYNNSQQNFLLVNDMIEIFAGMFGEYPFVDEKYGHVEFPWWGGMEHQTISSLGHIGFSNGNYSLGLIAHELAHQWWGNMISCGSFHHIWINEGFASYSEALIVEATEGKEAYHEHMEIEEYYGDGSIYVADTTNINRIFSGDLSYRKAAYVLHMLRHVLGDETFFAVLKAYGSDPLLQYGNAKTEDFQRVCEEVSGMKLDKFFQQWIYGEYFPVYAYGHNAERTANNGYRINLEIDQVQENTGLFWMPIDIRVTTASGQQTFVVWDSLQTQSFVIHVNEEPITVELDPDNWILKETRSKLLNPPLDKGVLLINGLSWRLGDKVFSAYENKAFWGNTEVEIWDLFNEPTGGYPPALIDPIANGKISASTIGRYSTIVWLSHNLDGDMQVWKDLPIHDYLKAGGNLLLITRMGQDYINNQLAEYLGITWDEKARQIVRDSKSVVPELSDMNVIQNQTMIDLFETTLTKDYSRLLFKATEEFDEEKGMGVHAKPDDGGEFIYIAGRSYLFDHAQIKSNMEHILQNYFGAVVTVEKSECGIIPAAYSLEQNYPNPFNPTTTIKYQVPKNKLQINSNNQFLNVRLKVYDILGKEVSQLVNRSQAPGIYQVKFNASNLPSGMYFYKLEAGSFTETKKMLLIK